MTTKESKGAMNMADTNDLLELQDKYQEILLADGGLRTLCNTLTEEIGHPVFILDRHQENLLYIDRKLRDDQEGFYGYLDDRQLIRQESVEFECGCQVNINKGIYSWQESEYVELQAHLGKEETLGILSIFLGANKKEVTKTDCLALTQAVYAISIKLHQNNLVQKLARKCSNELIEDLLQGRINDKEELVKRGELAGWDLTVSYQLFIFQFTSGKLTSEKESGERSLYTYELEDKLVNSLHRIIRTNISRKYIIFSYNSNVLLLMNYSHPGKERKKESELIHQQLEQKFPDLDIYLGAGCFVKECTEVPKSYQQGLYTLNFLTTTKQENKVFFYEDLGILRLLWEVEDPKLKEFAQEFLTPLLNYDQQNNTNWLETLSTFLQEGGSLQAAANKLHIHPNTMRYRINRIQEILDTDLKDFEVQLNLALAYKIYKFILGDEI